MSNKNHLDKRYDQKSPDIATRMHKSACGQASDKRFKFVADAVPYECSEDEDSPLLAFSKENAYFIFKIDKEKFRRMARAGIDYIDTKDNDCDSKIDTSLDFDDASGHLNGTSNETSKVHFCDVVHVLDSDNTATIMSAYQDDSNELKEISRKFEEDKGSLTHLKSSNCASCDQFTVIEVSTSSESTVSSPENCLNKAFNVENNQTSLKATVSNAEADDKDSSIVNDQLTFKNKFVDQEKTVSRGVSEFLENSVEVPEKILGTTDTRVPDKNQSELEELDADQLESGEGEVIVVGRVLDREEFERIYNIRKKESVDNTSEFDVETHVLDVPSESKQNLEEKGVDETLGAYLNDFSVEEMARNKFHSDEDSNFTVHTLNTSTESFPELEDVWPDMPEHIMESEIPATELKSFTSDGVLTKYFEFDLSNELFVLKVLKDKDHISVEGMKYRKLTATASTSGDHAKKINSVSERNISELALPDLSTENKSGVPEDASNCENSDVNLALSDTLDKNRTESNKTNGAEAPEVARVPISNTGCSLKVSCLENQGSGLPEASLMQDDLDITKKTDTETAESELLDDVPSGEEGNTSVENIEDIQNESSKIKSTEDSELSSREKHAKTEMQTSEDADSEIESSGSVSNVNIEKIVVGVEVNESPKTTNTDDSTNISRTLLKEEDSKSTNTCEETVENELLEGVASGAAENTSVGNSNGTQSESSEIRSEGDSKLSRGKDAENESGESSESLSSVDTEKIVAKVNESPKNIKPEDLTNVSQNLLQEENSKSTEISEDSERTLIDPGNSSAESDDKVEGSLLKTDTLLNVKNEETAALPETMVANDMEKNHEIGFPAGTADLDMARNALYHEQEAEGSPENSASVHLKVGSIQNVTSPISDKETVKESPESTNPVQYQKTSRDESTESAPSVDSEKKFKEQSPDNIDPLECQNENLVLEVPSLDSKVIVDKNANLTNTKQGTEKELAQNGRSDSETVSGDESPENKEYEDYEKKVTDDAPEDTNSVLSEKAAKDRLPLSKTSIVSGKEYETKLPEDIDTVASETEEVLTLKNVPSLDSKNVLDKNAILTDSKKATKNESPENDCSGDTEKVSGGESPQNETSVDYEKKVDDESPENTNSVDFKKMEKDLFAGTYSFVDCEKKSPENDCSLDTEKVPSGKSPKSKSPVDYEKKVDDESPENTNWIDFKKTAEDRFAGTYAFVDCEKKSPESVHSEKLEDKDAKHIPAVEPDNLKEESFETVAEITKFLMEHEKTPELEVISETGGLESDDSKSQVSESDDGRCSAQASESDDSRDNESVISELDEKSNHDQISETDEVDCAPTRVRTRKAASVLSEDVIPEDSVTNSVKSVKSRSFLGKGSKSTEKVLPSKRSLRSKSLEPSSQSSKTPSHSKTSLGNVPESSEITRRRRAATPEVVAKKDIKTVLRSSPRKHVRVAAASSEPVSTTKAANTRSGGSETQAKSSSNASGSTVNVTRHTKRVVKK